jgi:hypothetical protein
MRQTRSLSGSEFEKELCEKFGYVSDTKKPRINWPGIGSNILKIKSLNYDASKFRPLETSTFEKWDILTPDGRKREVKKYFTNEVSDWTLYSEPIVKVCTRRDLEVIKREYGNGDLELGRNTYNKFINELFVSLSQDGTFDRLLSKLTSNSEGIEFKDGFIERSQIEFRWNIRSSFWQGFDRIMLEFRIK